MLNVYASGVYVIGIRLYQILYYREKIELYINILAHFGDNIILNDERWVGRPIKSEIRNHNIYNWTRCRLYYLG